MELDQHTGEPKAWSIELYARGYGATQNNIYTTNEDKCASTPQNIARAHQALF